MAAPPANRCTDPGVCVQYLHRMALEAAFTELSRTVEKRPFQPIKPAVLDVGGAPAMELARGLRYQAIG